MRARPVDRIHAQHCRCCRSAAEGHVSDDDWMVLLAGLLMGFVAVALIAAWQFGPILWDAVMRNVGAA